MKKIILKFEDYYKFARESFLMIWQNKAVWFWGLFLFSGASFNFRQQNEQEMNGFDKEVVIDFFTKNWLFITIGVLVWLIFCVAIWLISAVARAGVIKEFDNKQNKKGYKLAFKKVWEVGKKYLKKIVLLDLAVSGAVLVILLIDALLGFLAVLTGETAIIILTIIILGLGSLLIFLFLAVLKPFALIKIVLSNVNMRNAFEHSWGMVKYNWKEFFKLILTLIVVGIVSGIAILLLAIIGTILIGLFWAITNSIGRNMFVSFFAILVGAIMLFVFFVIQAISNLWKMDILIWWVKKVKGGKIEEVKKVVKRKKAARGKTTMVGAEA